MNDSKHPVRGAGRRDLRDFHLAASDDVAESGDVSAPQDEPVLLRATTAVEATESAAEVTTETATVAATGIADHAIRNATAPSSPSITASPHTCRPCRIACQLLRGLMWSGLAATLLAAALLFTALKALAPQPGEWSTTVTIGPVSRAFSMPALLRMATHPLGLGLLDGRSLRTPQGRWHFQRTGTEAMQATCAPCALQLPALGPAPLVLPQVEVRLQRTEVDRYRGELRLAGRPGADEASLTLRWRARLEATGVAIDAELPATALADAYAALGAQAVPEIARARIAGQISGRVKARWPGGVDTPVVKVEGFEVDGLGTEALRDVALPEGCGRGLATAERVSGWLPRAVVAAEDQRFLEHPGYELPQMLAVWSANARAAASQDGALQGGALQVGTLQGGALQLGTLQGGSTISQQLAKRVYVGDERSAVRKLRELLYAVEMERTLGKGRILQLYLQLAPWGPGVCGADAAARTHLRKPVERLTPLEAAWLASLLRDGARGHAAGQIDRERVAFVLGSLRGPLSAARRAEQIEQLQDWAPPASR